jgi:FtsZ-binding cell division protein ZapB
MRDLEAKNETVSVLRVEVNGLKEGMTELRTEVSTLRKALYTAALSVAGGALVFAFTVFQVIGH